MMRWPDVSALIQSLILPNGVSLRLLRADEFEKLPALLLSWFPAVEVGAESIFLTPEFLRREVVCEGNLSPNIYAVFVTQDEAVVGFMTFERQPANATLHARLGALAPEARAGFLGALGFMVFEKLGVLCGAELLLTWMTLAGRHQQLFAERRGFQLVGVVPGFDRDLISRGRTMRVTEGLVAKLLVADTELLEPSPENMTPRTRRLLEAIRRG